MCIHIYYITSCHLFSILHVNFLKIIFALSMSFQVSSRYTILCALSCGATMDILLLCFGCIVAIWDETPLLFLPPDASWAIEWPACSLMSMTVC